MKTTSNLLLTLIIAFVFAFPVYAVSSDSAHQDTIEGSNISYASLPTLDAVNRDAIAIVIGNKNYKAQGKNVPDVQYAHNDVDVIKAFLVRSLGFREGNVVVLKDATFNEMVAHLGNATYARGKIYNLVREGKSDLFVYYSGHGAPSLNDGQGFLLPVDADPEVIELTGYPLSQFYSNIEKIPARTKTILIDACFSGNSSAGEIVKDASALTLKLKGASFGSGLTLLTAAGLSEVASWDHDSKTGLFTSHFIKGVSGAADKDGFGNQDRTVSLEELKKFLQSEVAYSARSMYNRTQVPQVKGQNDIFLAMWKLKNEEDRIKEQERRLAIEAQKKAAEEQRRIDEERRIAEDRIRRKLEEERLREEVARRAEEDRLRRLREEERESLANAKLKELQALEEKLKQQQLELKEKKSQREKVVNSPGLDVFVPPTF